MNRIYFQIPGQPVPWARARTKGTVHFTPKKQRLEKGAIQYHAKAAMGNKPLFSGPLHLAVQFVYSHPKSWTEAKKRKPESRWKTSRPDADNLLKLVKDALNGVVYHDDAQVTFTEVRKLYGEMTGTFVTVEPLIPDYESL